MSSVTIFQVASAIESAGHLDAMRFEPTVYATISQISKQSQAQANILARIKMIHNCSAGTAQMIYSTSWGAIQVMGFNLYASPISYPETVSEFMANESAQEAALEDFLDWKGIDFTPDQLAASHASRLKYALAYNGSAQYEAAMITALKALSLTVQ